MAQLLVFEEAFLDDQFNLYQQSANATEEPKSDEGLDPVLNVLLPILVFLLMLGMGASTRVIDFKRALKRPKGVLIGICSQFGFMPFWCYLLGLMFDLSTPVRVSMLVVGCVPGGSTSNVFSFWANGNVSLSITMTAISTTLAIGMLPFLLFVYLQAIDPSRTATIDWLTLISSLFLVVIPVIIGMAINYKWPVAAQWVTRVGSFLGIIVVIITLIYGGITNSHVFRSSWKIYVSIILVGIVGILVGYILARLTKCSSRDSRTIALETGIQNGPLAVALVELIRTNAKADDEMLTFPLFYSFWIVVESVIFALIWRRIPAEEPIQKDLLKHQSNKVTVTNKAGKEENVYRSLLSADSLMGPKEPITTLYENFQEAVKKFKSLPCLGWRDGKNSYQWHTYEEIDIKMKQLGAGLHHLGEGPKSFVGLYSINRKEWVISDLACSAFSLVSVPLYDTLGADAVEYIINKVKISTLICSKDKTKSIMELCSKCPSIKIVIQMDSIDDKSLQEIAPQIKLLSFEDVIALGIEHHHDPIPPNTEDMATICFTSGTTGLPKGAMISHKNLISSMHASYSVCIGEIPGSQKISDFGPDDVHISYLPLAHMFERILHLIFFHSGVAIGFFRGSVQDLVDDILELKPTIFPSVPRLLTRIHDRIIARVESQTTWWDSSSWPPIPKLNRWLFWKAYNTKKERLKDNQFEDGFWDSAVFSNVKARLGGRVRLIITGSAPLSIELMEFLRICFSCNVLEGYGQTETAAVTNVTLPGDLSVGHVGAPVPCTEIKLEDVPEMSFFNSDPEPRGEICFRGNNVFMGYFDEPEKTKETIDEDGWLHSGDIGRINSNGTLSIIDRKKNIFKLSQGEYIAPEKIENIYIQSKYVAQAFVHGDSFNHELVGIIVVDMEQMGPNNDIALQQQDAENPNEAKASLFDDATREMILKDITRVGQENKLFGFEQVKAIYLEKEPFSVENNCLTPTFKLKRHELKIRYAKEIEELYKQRAQQQPPQK